MLRHVRKGSRIVSLATEQLSPPKTSLGENPSINIHLYTCLCTLLMPADIQKEIMQQGAQSQLFNAVEQQCYSVIVHLVVSWPGTNASSSDSCSFPCNDSFDSGKTPSLMFARLFHRMVVLNIRCILIQPSALSEMPNS